MIKRRRRQRWMSALSVLAALSVTVCGGGDEDPESGASLGSAGAVEVIVEFAVAVELTDLVILEIFSGGFEHRLLAAEVEVDSNSFLKLVGRWEVLAELEQRTLAAFDELNTNSVRRTAPESPPYVSRQPAGASLGVRMPATGSGPFDAVKEAATAFFDWVGGSGTRSRERVQVIAGALSDAQLEQLVAEWRQFYPGQSQGIDSAEEFKRRLDAGELDAQASRLHTQLLDVSASSSGAYQYSEFAQDENALLAQVAFEEGAEGLKRGAEFNVQATLAVLNAQFPDIQQGVEYANQASEYAEYARDVYNDPTGAALSAIRSELDERVLEPLGERLDAGFEETFGEDLAGLISEAASDALGFGAPSEALTAGADAGFVELEATVRAALATTEEPGDGQPLLTVAVVDPNDPRLVLAPGDYDILVLEGDGDEATLQAGTATVVSNRTVALAALTGDTGAADDSPEGDKDGDTIPDARDLCPERPEDFDTFEDSDGCPDEDNDGDKILDVTDQCPNKAENFNGVEDDDGCPDEDDPDPDGDPDLHLL